MDGLAIAVVIGLLGLVSFFFLRRALFAKRNSLAAVYLVLAILPFSEILLNYGVWIYVKAAERDVTEEHVARLVSQQRVFLRVESIFAPPVLHLIDCEKFGVGGCRRAYATVLGRAIASSLIARIPDSDPFFHRLSDKLNLNENMNFIRISIGDKCNESTSQCYFDTDYGLSFQKNARFRDTLVQDRQACRKKPLLIYQYDVCDRVSYFESNRGFVEYARIVGLPFPYTLDFLNGLYRIGMERPTVIVSLNWLTGNAENLDVDKATSLLLEHAG